MVDRIITAIGLIVFLAIIAIINNYYLTAFVISIVTILALFEAKKLLKVEERVFYFLSFMSIIAIFSNPVFILVVSVLAVAGYVAFYQKELNIAALAIYPFASMMLFMDLYFNKGLGVIGWLIVIIALTDTFAYLIGKSIAKRFFKNGFSPTSPNKSWEGVIGGVLVGSIIGSIVGLAFFDFWSSFFISLMISIAGVFGDLFESYLKRRAGVKDSGNILPGHGGVLDRIDAYLFGAPLMWVLIV
jgi:phosphatidate cytidylyltransferase